MAFSSISEILLFFISITSTAHMKMKLPSLEGKVITIRVDQKMAWKCYESNLKSRMGTYTITTQLRESGWVVEADLYDERWLKPIGEIRELGINGKRFKLGASLCKELEDKVVEVIAKNMTFYVVDLPWTKKVKLVV